MGKCTTQTHVFHLHCAPSQASKRQPKTLMNAVNDSCIPWTWFQAECRFAALWPTHCSATEYVMHWNSVTNYITLTGLARPQYLHPPHPHSQTVWHSQCRRRAHTACSQGASISFKAKNPRHTSIYAARIIAQGTADLVR